MVILGVETSCDETALSIIEINEGKSGETEIKILANMVLSQIAIHAQYGGVFPMVAKREHQQNLIPLLKKTLEEAKMLTTKNSPLKTESATLALEREPELLKQFLELIPTIEEPPIDLIAVTAGPGLEPALWVGINFAKALSIAWDIPVVATNHMEGHILISLLEKNPENKTGEYKIKFPAFPALALLISGGHTEMVLMRDWLKYEIVGRTRDDAVGEAFDKVARILGLPYPGGPEISRLAEEARKGGKVAPATLPRPMLHSDNLDFSFSGLKTAVLYLVKKLPAPLEEKTKMAIAREFEDAATEVVVEKVRKAIAAYGVETLILGGGVVANKNIRAAFEKLTQELGISLHLPAINHATDNALMIALAGFFNRKNAVTETTGLFEIKASGNLHFD